MSSDSQPVSVSKAALWAGRIVSGLCVLFLTFDGVMKLIQPPQVVEASAEMGLPQSALAGIGVVLLISLALYVIPATAALGAILLTGYLGGAIATHVRVGGPAFPIIFASVFGMLVWLGLFLRDRRVRALIPLRRV